MLPVPYTTEELSFIQAHPDKHDARNIVLRHRYQAEKDFAHNEKIRAAKERSDKGKKRKKYGSNLTTKYKSYLMRANGKGISFDFTEDEFYEITARNCTYCGEPGPNGIDRVNSKIGYTKSNSVPCCWACNQMKYISSAKAFMDHVRKIYDFQFNN